MATEANQNDWDQYKKENEEKNENREYQEEQENKEKQKEQVKWENQEGSEGEQGDQWSQEKKMNLKNYLILLHISAIFLLVCLGILLIFYVLNPISKQDESTGKSLIDAERPFFDSNTVYYVKKYLENEEPEYIVGLMKNLKMDRGAIDKTLRRLNLKGPIESGEDSKQYFFYKAHDETIYTFIKLRKEKKPSSERIMISILEGKNPNPKTAWGIYHLEKILIQGSADEFLYTFDYIKGKYKEKGRKPKNYAPLAIHIKDHSLDNIVNLFAEGIQKAINGNLRNAKRNGENLVFRFSLYRNNEKNRYVKVSEKKLHFPLNSTKRWMPARNPTPEATHEEIDTFEIDDDRKNSLKEELMIAFKDLFSTEDEKAIKSKLEIYKDGINISTSSNSSYSFGKVKALLKDNEHNSYQEWQSHFESAEIGIDCLGFIKYINDKSEELGEGGTGEKELTVAREAIFTIIAIIIVLILYVYFWYDINLKIKKDAMREDEDGEKKDADKEKEMKALEEYEIDMEKVGEEAGEAEPPGKDSLLYLTGMQKHKLEEIKDSLAKTRDKALEIYTNKLEKKQDDNLELDKLRIAEILIRGIVEEKNLKHEVFELKLKKTQEILREFLKGNKITEIDENLEEIQKELDSFEIPGPPREEPFPLPPVPEPATEPTTTNTDQILTGIQKDIKDKVIPALKGLGELHTKYREIIETIKSSTSTDDQAVSNEDVMTKMLDSSTKNSQLLQKVDENIDAIIKDSKDNNARLHQLLRYVNQETSLIFRKDNVLDIIDKVSGEAIISKEYRLCAVNLHDDLSTLEEKYQDTWCRQLLADGFLYELKENMNLFSLKNEEAKTIYDRYFNKEIPLRDIDREDIRKAITHLHWFKFWDGLIRMSDFFNAYFDDEMADIKFLLGHYSQKIKKILKKLGYEINHIAPLSLIPNDYRKQHEVEQADKSYIQGVILKNLVESNNKKLKEAADNIPPGHEIVVYVDRLGLIDKLAEEPVLISKIRFEAYNKTLLRSYLASGKSV